MATRGRPPGQGKVPGSGRKRGGLDKSARLLITETMAADILKVYKRLGKDWLFEVAKTRPDLFINQCLSRLLPPAFKDGADVELYQQVNIGEMSDLEAGRRVAFALAKAVHDDPSLAIDITPETTEPVTPRRPDAPPEAFPNCWQPPSDAPPLLQPEPEPLDDDRARWVAELPLTAQERADSALIRETRECNLSSYRGGNPAEQGLGSTRSPTSAAQDPRAAQRDRLLARRRKDLL